MEVEVDVIGSSGHRSGRSDIHKKNANGCYNGVSIAHHLTDVNQNQATN
jgi:hypothetical protein